MRSCLFFSRDVVRVTKRIDIQIIVVLSKHVSSIHVSSAKKNFLISITVEKLCVRQFCGVAYFDDLNSINFRHEETKSPRQSSNYYF